MHVNSHEEDEESAAGHRHLDLQHTMMIMNSAGAPALATPPNNNMPQIEIHLHQQIHHNPLRCSYNNH